MWETTMVAADQLHRIAVAAGREAGGVPPDLLGDYLPIVVDAAATGRRLTKSELHACHDRGADAAHGGVPLRELVDLYLSATWRLWRHLPTGRGRGERPGEAVLRAADDAVASATGGYQEARRRMVRREIGDRREFVDDVLSGRTDVARLVERAAQYGLQLTGTHVVCVADTTEPLTDASPLIAKVEHALPAAFVASKGGRLVCIAADDPVDRLVKQLPRRAQVGVGRPYSGPAGVVRSYEEALDALDVAGRVDLPGPVQRAADLLVYQVIGRDRAALVDLVQAVLSPLSTARGGAEPLIDTLAVYFAAGTVTAEAARRLHLSVRAVTYRLERVRQLTGHNPDLPADRFTLQVAVLGAQLLNWPTAPLA
jgi:DNA-binding PucR family transcriptional regulator